MFLFARNLTVLLVLSAGATLHAGEFNCSLFEKNWLGKEVVRYKSRVKGGYDWALQQFAIECTDLVRPRYRWECPLAAEGRSDVFRMECRPHANAQPGVN